jgi:hypothetical protein
MMYVGESGLSAKKNAGTVEAFWLSDYGILPASLARLMPASRHGTFVIERMPLCESVPPIEIRHEQKKARYLDRIMRVVFSALC